MTEREKVISTLEEIKTQTAEIGLDSAVIAHKFIDKILALLKEQDELLHKKQKDVDRLCNEISEWKHKYHDSLLKEQGAVKPHYNARTNWYECGNCHYSMTSGMHCRSELIPATKVRYCANCGFPVNWEGL